jgi:hypothetical protein
MLAEIYNWFTEGFDTADLKNVTAFFRGGTDQRSNPDFRPRPRKKTGAMLVPH